MAKLFYYKYTGFENLDTVLRLFKKADKSLDEVMVFFSQPENLAHIMANYATLTPFTVSEAMHLENIEQRMTALGCFPAEEVAAVLKPELIDEQTIGKKQFEWDEHGKMQEKVYQDTYSLYRIDTTALINGNTEDTAPEEYTEDEDDEFYDDGPEYIYYVKCLCPSTGRNYHVYVDEETGVAGDAIRAIAFTMRINGQPITKEMYLSLMYAES